MPSDSSPYAADILVSLHSLTVSPVTCNHKFSAGSHCPSLLHCSAGCEMPALVNPLISPGGFLCEETERVENTHELDGLFTGSVEQVAERWAASAVLDKTGHIHIVRLSEHVQESGATKRIRLYSGGAVR